MDPHLNHLAARPTTYKGIRMRSRLEALYAASIDGYPAAWSYEPRCFANETGQYLPDFVLRWTLDEPTDVEYVEIKPTRAQAEAAVERMRIILDSEPESMLSVRYPVGTWPDIDFVRINARRHAGVRSCIPTGTARLLDAAIGEMR